MVSRQCVELVKACEGCELLAYPDPATGGAPWTIGYGHTQGVYEGLKITQETADNWLLKDLELCEKEVRALVKIPVNINQLAALTSFSFNLGAAALANSTLLKKLNSGDYQGAAAQFVAWDKANGEHNHKDDDGDGLIDEKGEKQVMAGLHARRLKERDLFLTHI